MENTSTVKAIVINKLEPNAPNFLDKSQHIPSKHMYNLHPEFGLLFKIEKFCRFLHIKTIGDM